LFFPIQFPYHKASDTESKFVAIFTSGGVLAPFHPTGQESAMSQSDKQKELAYAALLLERQLESYQRLHEEEMAALREALRELKDRILALDDREETNRIPPSLAEEESQ